MLGVVGLAFGGPLPDPCVAAGVGPGRLSTSAGRSVAGPGDVLEDGSGDAVSASAMSSLTGRASSSSLGRWGGPLPGGALGASSSLSSWLSSFLDGPGAVATVMRRRTVPPANRTGTRSPWRQGGTWSSVRPPPGRPEGRVTGMTTLVASYCGVRARRIS
ncbi:hypothetical protein GCM10018791_17360 [Streptomyces zaomyceticus]|nr:hypothetical protein GCM10018791_17360 [Streptomyces zaomyceticus]